MLLLVLQPGSAAAGLTVIGASGADRQWLEAQLPVPECISPGWHAARFARELRERMAARRRSQGDYTARLRLARHREAGCVDFELTVEPGPEARITGSRIGISGPGAADPALAGLLPAEGLGEGDPFLEASYEAFKGALLSAAVERGYFDAAFAQARVEVRLQTDADFEAHESLTALPELTYAALPPAVSIDLQLATGPRFVLRDIDVDIDGMRPDEAVVRRYLRIAPGDLWDREKVDDTRRALLESGYFEDVRLRPVTGPAGPGRVDLRVEVRPIARYEVTTGIGYGTDTGARVHAEFADRLARSGGHRYEVRGLLAVDEQQLAAVYSLPARARDSFWGYEVAANRLRTASSEELRVGVGARRVTEITRRFIRTARIDFSRTAFEFGNAAATGAGTERSRFLVAGMDWTYLGIDAGNRMAQGTRADLQLSFAEEALLSSASLAQVRLRLRKARRFGARMRLNGFLELGALATSDFDALPPSHRFFAGGDDSVRGFDRDALGPERDGEVVGGRYLLVGSVEAERLIRGAWGAAVFVDAGNAFDDLQALSVEVSAGVGVRWYSPIGSLRLDVAWPLAQPQPRLHLTIGRNF